MEAIFYFETSQSFYCDNQLLTTKGNTFEVMKFEHSAKIPVLFLSFNPEDGSNNLLRNVAEHLLQ
jgi:hypothetical protein